MKWEYKSTIEDSPYPGKGYIPEGAIRIRSIFCWLPTRVNQTVYWLTRISVTEVSTHKWYGGSEGGLFVDWNIVDIHPHELM